MDRFQISTEHPTARESMDTLHPNGTIKDNSINLNFNRRVISLFQAEQGKPRISVLDLGCAGGGMVESFIAMGQEAVGVEGCEYNLVHKRAAWGTVPESLFTADASKPFTIHRGDFVPVKFDLVTAWEFFEHIEEKDLPGVCENIRRHIKTDGLVMGTTTDLTSRRGAIIWHVTQKDGDWWMKFFESEGFDYRGDLLLAMGGDLVRYGKYRLVLELNDNWKDGRP